VAAVLLPEEFSQAQSDAKGRHVIHDEVAERLEREASLMSQEEDGAERTRRRAGLTQPL
jgi:hypothetical protein